MQENRNKQLLQIKELSNTVSTFNDEVAFIKEEQKKELEAYEVRKSSFDRKVVASQLKITEAKNKLETIELNLEEIEHIEILPFLPSLYPIAKYKPFFNKIVWGFNEGIFVAPAVFIEENLEAIVDNLQSEITINRGNYSFNEIACVIMIDCEELPEDYFLESAVSITEIEGEVLFELLSRSSKYGLEWDFEQKITYEEFIKIIPN